MLLYEYTNAIGQFEVVTLASVKLKAQINLILNR